MLFFAAWPVLPIGEPEGLGQAAKHDLALFFNSILLRQPPGKKGIKAVREGLRPDAEKQASL